MNVLVSGGTGFLGRYVSNDLINSGHKVFIVNSSGVVDKSLFSTNIEVYKYDGSFASINEIPSVDVVVHLAACFECSGQIENIDNMIDVNLRLGVHLLEWMKSRSIKRIIYSSTFSIAAAHGLPQNFYSLTKACFEKILDFYASEYGYSIVSLDVYDTYGDNDTRDKFLNKLLASLADGSPFPMSLGEQEISYVHVQDVARAFIIAIESSSIDSVGHQSFSLLGQEIVTLKSIAERTMRLLKVSVPLMLGRYEYRPNEIMCVNPRHKRLPGWSPKISFDAGVKNMWRSLKSI